MACGIFYFKKHLCIYLAALSLSCSMRGLVPQPGIKPRLPVLRARSLNQWLIREVPCLTEFRQGSANPAVDRFSGGSRLCYFSLLYQGQLFLCKNGLPHSRLELTPVSSCSDFLEIDTFQPFETVLGTVGEYGLPSEARLYLHINGFSHFSHLLFPKLKHSHKNTHTFFSSLRAQVDFFCGTLEKKDLGKSNLIVYGYCS